MEDRQSHPSPDRDLRTLSTEDLLSLIERDITELDQRIGMQREAEQRRRAARPRTVREAMDSLAPEIPLPFHTVTCCNHHMGDFPGAALVRCPFCGTWHRAADFPFAPIR